MPPFYIEVMNELRRQIDGGVWKAGDRLPSDRELSKKYNVSPGTIRLAMDHLAENGVISRIHGSGTFILGSSPTQKGIKLNELASSFLRKQEYSVSFVSMGKGSQNKRVLDMLRLHHNKKYIELVRSGSVEGKNICVFYTYLPYDNYKAFLDIPKETFSSTTPWKLLTDNFGFSASRIDETIEVMPPGDKEKELLGIGSNTLLLVTENIYFTEEGMPVKFQIGKWNLGSLKLLRSLRV